MFSEKELEVTRWVCGQLGLHSLPSVKQLKDHRARVLTVAGLTTVTAESQQHNIYAYNDIKRIIEHVHHICQF